MSMPIEMLYLMWMKQKSNCSVPWNIILYYYLAVIRYCWKLKKTKTLCFISHSYLNVACVLPVGDKNGIPVGMTINDILTIQHVSCTYFNIRVNKIIFACSE